MTDRLRAVCRADPHRANTLTDPLQATSHTVRTSQHTIRECATILAPEKYVELDAKMVQPLLDQRDGLLENQTMRLRNWNRNTVSVRKTQTPVCTGEGLCMAQTSCIPTWSRLWCTRQEWWPWTHTSVFMFARFGPFFDRLPTFFESFRGQIPRFASCLREASIDRSSKMSEYFGFSPHEIKTLTHTHLSDAMVVRA